MVHPHEHHLEVARTARYHTLGDPAGAPRQVWFVLHGHAQLAGYFIRHFAAIDDGSRLVVAPEALNRFYLEETTWKGAGHARVGATWMTREDRLAEINDYVGYLDALHDEIFTRVPREQAKLVVLGFSQGVATACRWLAEDHARADRLIFWAGPLPPELDAAAAAPLRRAQIFRVLGETDHLAAPEAMEVEETRLKAMAIEAPLIRFAGGHQLNADVLRTLAE